VFSNRIVGFSIDSRVESRLLSWHSTTGSPAEVTCPAARFTPSEDRNFVHGDSSALWATTAWSDPWAAVPPETTPRWRTFFSLLQNNVLNRRTWATREDRIVIVT
jgi:putative transposase